MREANGSACVGLLGSRHDDNHLQGGGGGGGSSVHAPYVERAHKKPISLYMGRRGRAK